MNDDLRKLLSSHVNEHNYDIDPQEIWDGILVKQRKEKRRAIYWVFPFLGVVLVLLGMFIYNNLEPATIPSNGDSGKQEILAMENQTTDSKQNKEYDTKENLENQLDNKKETLQSDETKGTGSINEVTTNIVANTTIQKAIKRTISINDNFQKITAADGFTTRKVNQDNARNADKSSDDISFRHALGSEKKVSFPSFPVIKLPSIIEHVQRIEALKFSSLNQGLASNTSLIDEALYNLEIIKPRRTNRRFSFKLMGGAGLLYNSVMAAVPDMSEVNINKANRLDSSLSPKVSYSGRAMLGMSLSAGFEFSTGLGYEQVVETFDYDANYFVDADGDVFTGAVSDVSGSNAVDFNSSSVTEDYYVNIERSIIAYNSYHYLDIPLQLGYNLSCSRWSPSFYIGTMIPVYTLDSGYTYNSLGVPVTFAESSIQNKISNKYYAGIGLDYHFSARFVATIGFEYGTRNRSYDGVETNHRSLTNSLGLGIKF